ncbi:permease prefix domain 1-containing protein [Streptomyces sp. TRM64462]|uniref:permease prefix domain 1-containing protein n=1 Tax=Streptomyces sp. TRM64462 TaxID=2741726 RepID=UPI001586D5BB|nr:permease prefix domain 1-containing protein [Streptomyces sp. TRM64462]
MSAATDGYVEALAAVLHGPARLKARMLEEIRDGLHDTVAAYAGAGLPAAQAATAAVRDFGTPQELAPALQRELTIAQARRTARTAALTVPVAAVCWLLVRSVGDAAAPYLTAHLATAAATAALLAVVTLAATGPLARRLPTPHRLPLAVAWTGTAASVAMALAALALAVLAVAVTDWPVAAAAGALAAAAHAVTAGSARTCRQCALSRTGSN